MRHQTTRSNSDAPPLDTARHDRLLLAVNPDNRRGMRDLVQALPTGVLARAARTLLDCTGRVIIITGFPVADLPETDGPAGALALYEGLAALGKHCVIASWPQVLGVLRGCRHDLQVIEVPRPADAATAPVPSAAPRYALAPGDALLSIEVCGRCRDGSYRNMARRDIRAHTPGFEDWFGCHALVAIGDGGNEFGMGSAPAQFFQTWQVMQPVSTSTHLVPAGVSNDGAYALLASLALLSGRPAVLPDAARALAVLEHLHREGFVDGFSGTCIRAVDGRPFEHALQVLQHLHELVKGGD